MARKRSNPTEAPKHIGFEAAVEHARAGGAYNPRGAIAAAAQKASAKAKRRNPRLSRVAGVGKNKKAGAAG